VKLTIHLYLVPWSRMVELCLLSSVCLHGIGKGKVFPVQAVEALGLREVEAPTFSNIRLIDGGKVLSPTRPPSFTPQEDSWYLFLLEAESNPRP
jgi:hypothetical protein